jgi:hypothetical protein
LLLQIQMIIYAVHTLVGLIGILVSNLRHFLLKECGNKAVLTMQSMKENADPLYPVNTVHRDSPRSDKRRCVPLRKIFLSPRNFSQPRPKKIPYLCYRHWRIGIQSEPLRLLFS